MRQNPPNVQQVALLPPPTSVIAVMSNITLSCRCCRIERENYLGEVFLTSHGKPKKRSPYRILYPPPLCCPSPYLPYPSSYHVISAFHGLLALYLWSCRKKKLLQVIHFPYVFEALSVFLKKQPSSTLTVWLIEGFAPQPTPQRTRSLSTRSQTMLKC